MPDLCPAAITPFAEGRAPEGGVIYHAEDRVLVLADGPEGLATARLLAAERRVTFAAPGLSMGEQDGVRLAPGRAAEAKGWLGAFEVHVAADADSHATPHHADVLIDLCAEPAIASAIAPPGYLRGAPGDAEAVADRARAFRGFFHKPKFFTYAPEICAHEVNGQAACSRCLDACDADAIRSRGGEIFVEPHLCQGCASCTLACPTGALSVAAPDRAALWARTRAAIAQGEGVLRVAEEEGRGALNVEALPRFGEELWFAALAEGAPAVALIADPAAPPREARLLSERVGVASAIGEALGLGADAVRLDADGSGAGGAGEAVRANEAAPPMDPARKRALLNAALARLEPEGFAGAPLPDGATLGAIAVDPAACILCGICARSCPTACLRYGEGERAVLEFAESNCIQCGACERICPEQAITRVARLAPWAERGAWREINAGEMARCVETGAPYMSQRMLEAILERARVNGILTPKFEAQMRRAPQIRSRVNS